MNNAFVDQNEKLDLINDFVYETESSLDDLDISIKELRNFRYDVDFEFNAYIGFIQGMDIETYIKSLESINRTVHTIKGLSLFLDLDNVNKYCHGVEELTLQLSKGIIYLDFNGFEIIEKIPMIINRFLEVIKEKYTDSSVRIDTEVAQIDKSTEDLTKNMNGKVIHLKDLQGKDFGRVRDQKKDLKVSINLDEYDDILQDFQAFSQDIVSSMTQSGQNREATQNIKRILMEHLDRLVLSARGKIVLSRYPRLVSDLSSSLGKKITFNILNNNAYARPDVWDRCHNALVHIVRNSVDHAIEPPDERIKLGKEPVGNMTMNINEDFRNIYISIEDDGKGIDGELIGGIAVGKGVINDNELKKMSELEKQRLIFSPGFSTRETASDVSGRGVGMDVVIKEIEESLNGKVILNSKKNVGTSFILEIPKAETLSECIKFGDDNHNYAIPVVPGIEFLECETKYISNLLDKTALYTKGNLKLPLVNLFIELGHKEYFQKSIEFMPIIRIGKDKDQFGIIVPKILGTERIKIDRRREFSSLIQDEGLVFGYGLTDPVTVVFDIDKIRDMINL